MADMNEQLVAFDQEMMQLRSTIEDLYRENMVLNGWYVPVAAGTHAFGWMTYALSPVVGLVAELDLLQLGYDRGYTITSPNRNVAFDVALSMMVGGGSLGISLDSRDLVDLGSWSFRVSGLAGYHNASVAMEKNIRLDGIEQFTLMDEADVTSASSAWGTKLAAGVAYRIGDTFSVELDAAWRSLVIPDVAANVYDPTEMIDLDFSGFAVAVGFTLRF
jgi:hypothetical protein